MSTEMLVLNAPYQITNVSNNLPTKSVANSSETLCSCTTKKKLTAANIEFLKSLGFRVSIKAQLSR